MGRVSETNVSSERNWKSECFLPLCRQVAVFGGVAVIYDWCDYMEKDEVVVFDRICLGRR